jgi:hypothetical protein
MNKTQIWNEVKAIIEAEVATSKQAKVIEALAPILAPKRGGATRPTPIEVDGEVRYHCRYTDAFWAAEDMIYQNDAKREALEDKGYSKLGISLWERGRKHANKLQAAIGEALAANNVDEAKQLNEELMLFNNTKPYNDAEWLYNNVANDEERALIDAHKA